MRSTELRHLVVAARELASMYGESFNLMRGNLRELRSTKNLWSRESEKSRSLLVKIGLLLIAFPDPTISDLIGAFIVIAGLTYSRVRPPPIYIEDVLSKLVEEMKKLRRAQISSGHIAPALGPSSSNEFLEPLR